VKSNSAYGYFAWDKFKKYSMKNSRPVNHKTDQVNGSVMALSNFVVLTLLYYLHPELLGIG